MTRKIYLVGNIRLLKIGCALLLASVLLNVILISARAFEHATPAKGPRVEKPDHNHRRSR